MCFVAFVVVVVAAAVVAAVVAARTSNSAAVVAAVAAAVRNLRLAGTAAAEAAGTAAAEVEPAHKPGIVGIVVVAAAVVVGTAATVALIDLQPDYTTHRTDSRPSPRHVLSLIVGYEGHA